MSCHLQLTLSVNIIYMYGTYNNTTHSKHCGKYVFMNKKIKMGNAFVRYKEIADMRCVSTDNSRM